MTMYDDIINMVGLFLIYKYLKIKFVVNFMIILYNTWVLMISKRGLILSKIYGKGEKNEKNV